MTPLRAPSAGTLAEKDRNATVHAVGASGTRELAAGEAIAQGDTIDVRSGRAIFTRTVPSAVTWSLEDGSQVEVRAARGTLILALAKGAVEAQVAPVEAGEAFAIDVEGTRVAVHGTHLRVERQGSRAIVDLREGVVSIGLPPKSGSTYGDLVTAPAHVEFDPADPHGTLKVTHEAARVRVAQSLSIPAPKPAHGEEAAARPLPRPAPNADRAALRADSPSHPQPFSARPGAAASARIDSGGRARAARDRGLARTAAPRARPGRSQRRANDRGSGSRVRGEAREAGERRRHHRELAARSCASGTPAW